ncbi:MULTISPECIES: winged helix-turn-helix domain-containing protein [unclassified Arthrobacter]|uniref:pullulanase X25 domain-containing protein n=1 Tax=unclassified Arthrobacter TaxID=235627 RepID=UPI00215743C5|nr:MULTISPECIES: winged helix-turn-helix domain-containing protein [unclassified Arthrobacter]
MAKNSIENTALRLRAVLEVLAAEDPSAERRISRGEVLSAAVTRVPLTGSEAELLASGAARGERALSNASSKLVKAGWITKEGRAGWSITASGRRALQDFPDTADLLAAMNGKAPAAASPAASADVEEVIEEALQEAAAVPGIPPEHHGAHEGAELPEPSFPQPDAVVIAGNMGSALGRADWDPAGLQLTFDRSDELWKLTADLPAGHYEYKVALDGSWDENYGQHGHRDGANMNMVHDGGSLTFLYDHATHTVVTKPDVSA